DQCLDSPYLKETNLYLLRMLPVETWPIERAPLSDADREHLLPQYVERQTSGAHSRAVEARRKERERVQRNYRNAKGHAETEYRAYTWLLDRGFSLDNVIYYSHTGRFCFGRRDGGLSPAVKSKLLDVLSEFPYDY